jgi:uncharacterized protein YjiS (DUF1127 family)
MLTRTNIAPPLAACLDALGALRHGLPRMRAAVEAWLRLVRPRSALTERPTGHLLHDIGLESGGNQNTRAIPFRLPRQL